VGSQELRGVDVDAFVWNSLQVCPGTVRGDAKSKDFVASAFLRAETDRTTQCQEKADGQQNFEAIVFLLWKQEKILSSEQKICKKKATLNQLYYVVSRP
jgi:hypothetical protein